MQAKLYFDRAKLVLASIYEQTEANEIAFLLINHLSGLSKTDVLLNKPVDIFNEFLFNISLERLLKYEPIQYVIGKAHFLGREFIVNKHTLIPRPETEELVTLIIARNKGKSGLKILDIGTGSGCISISLKLEMPDNEYIGVDICQLALDTEQQNALQFSTPVEFQKADILNNQPHRFSESKFDIIVSNPPYVLESDKKGMKPNVLDYEPHTALFVPDTNPLLFYEAILIFAHNNLKIYGRLYFEIYEKKGIEIKELMYKYQFINISIEVDFNKKARFAIGTFAPK